MTLNFGIRLDYATNPIGWAGGNNTLTTLVGSFRPPIGPLATAPDCTGETTAASYAGCLTGMLYACAARIREQSQCAELGPRFGFAYDPFKDHKTSIRGGFGIFHDPVAARIYESGFIATPPATFYEVFEPCFPTHSQTLPSAWAVCRPLSGFLGLTRLHQPNSPALITKSRMAHLTKCSTT